MNLRINNIITSVKRILQSFLYEFILILLWITYIFVINPIGNFPLNDDWVYAKIVNTLLNEGKYIPGSGPIATLIAQVYWGALFCSIFSFSFTILRFSTLILGIFGILFLFSLLKKITLNRNYAFVGAFIISINPLYLSLSYTFMTDVPFTSVSILATLLFYLFFKKLNIIWLMLATIISIIAVMIRQLGFLLTFSFALTYLLTNKLSPKSVIKAILPFLISLSLFGILFYWINHTKTIPDYNNVYGIDNITQPFKGFIIDYIFKFILRIGSSLILCSISLSPIIIFFSPLLITKVVKTKRILPFIIAGIFTIIYIPVYICFYSASHLFKGNVLFNLGLGPKLLRDTYIMETNISPMLNTFSLNIIFIIGVTLFFILLVLLTDTFIDLIKKLNRHIIDSKLKILLFSFNILIFYMGYFSLSTKYHDRYLLLLIIFMLIILIISYYEIIIYKSNIRLILAFSFIILISYFSLSATHDYLSWNRARWKAINYLVEEKQIFPLIIDGGYEYNGLNNNGGDEMYVLKKARRINNKKEYIVAFGKICNYSSIKTFRYPYLLWGTNNKIEVLKKDSLLLK
jgi:4-amino-4-deoxy-L-arabinose transferase-like glycosyltransferase